jgi:WD40 repeat protein
LVHASDSGGTQVWRLTADHNGPRALPVDGDASAAGAGELFRVATDKPAASNTGPSVRIIRVSDGADVARYEFAQQVVAAVLSDDGNTLAVVTAVSTRAGWDAQLHVSNVSSRQTIVAPLPGLHHDRDIRLLSVSPTGTYVAVASGRGFAVLDGRTLKPVTELYHPYPGGIAFQPAGLLVATTGIDRRTRVWDLKSNLEIARVHDDAPVKNLSLSADGRWLATMTETGVARIWAIRPADLIRQACARIGQPCP